MTTVTTDTFRAALPAARVQLVEDVIVASLRATRPSQPDWFDGTTHLADLAIDSIQLVEMKFALDQLVGQELDIAVFVTNPTLHELATSIAAAGQ
jgi:acyl carrier protein